MKPASGIKAKTSPMRLFVLAAGAELPNRIRAAQVILDQADGLPADSSLAPLVEALRSATTVWTKAQASVDRTFGRRRVSPELAQEFRDNLVAAVEADAHLALVKRDLAHVLFGRRLTAGAQGGLDGDRSK